MYVKKVKETKSKRVRAEEQRPVEYFIIKRSRQEYLMTRIERMPRAAVVYSIYHYDAARFAEVEKAKRIVKRLQLKSAEENRWEICRFNILNGNEETVWTGR